MKHILISIVLFIVAVSDLAVDKSALIPDILDLLRLQAGLPIGTIAWATIDQLYPTQSQIGKREVKRKVIKAKKF